MNVELDEIGTDEVVVESSDVAEPTRRSGQGCPFHRESRDVPVVPMPPPGASMDLWMRENLSKHSVFRVAGRGHRYYMTGREARSLVNDRIADRKGHFPLLYPGDTDFRMIPEITQVLDHFSHDDAVRQLTPTLQRHVDSWLSKQILDVQQGCLDLAWELSWEVQMGEPSPLPSDSFSKVVATMGRGDFDGADVLYQDILDGIGESCERANPETLTEHCLLAHFLKEEATGAMSRTDTIYSIAHGLITGFAIGPIISGMMAELGRAHDTTQGLDAGWRREYLDSNDALQMLVTEAAHLYPRVLTQQGTLPEGTTHRVNGVDIPGGSVVVMSIYAENLSTGAGFHPERWAGDPTDVQQQSGAFAGCPYNNNSRDSNTGIPHKIRCPATPLIRRIVAAFAQHIITKVKWLFQDLPSQPTATDDGVMYPLGLMACVCSIKQPLPRSVWPADNPRTLKPGSSVVVVGGSIGGLVAARELQQRGCDVRVIEAASEIGAGKCETVEIDGRSYDVGAHLVSMTGPVAELAKEVGVAMKESPGGAGYETFLPGHSVTEKQMSRMNVFTGLSETMHQLEELGFTDEQLGFERMEHLASLLKKDGANKSIVDFAKPFFYGAGYGMENLSSAYMLRFANAVLQRGDSVGGTPACGFGPFLKTLASDLNVTCGVAVTNVDRTGDAVKVHLSSGEVVECDELFVACQKPWRFLKDDIDSRETDLLRQVRYFPYMTSIVRASGLSRKGLCVAEQGAQQGALSAYIYFHEDTDVVVCWGYAAEGQSDEEYFEATLRELRSMGATFPEEQPEPLFLQRWDYFPHVSPGDFAAGFYTKLAEQQGKNHTWFGGGLTSFELTDCITAWTRDFVEKVCREVPEAASQRDVNTNGTITIRLPESKEDTEGCAAWLEDLEQAFPTLVHGFAFHAETIPDREMFVAIEKGRHPWTYASMWQQALGIGEQLRSYGLQPGDRVLVMYAPNSIHFPAAFWGCLVNGFVAVPVPPPRPMVGDVEGFERLNLIANDCSAAAILTDTFYTNLTRMDGPLQAVKRVFSRGKKKALSWPEGVKWICTDKAPPTGPAPERFPEPDELAYVQYTSGSTRAPRGVYITHQMVMQNCLSATRDTVQLPGSRCVTWLPWWHDLMVVTGACIPAVIGNTLIFFSAMKWLKDPTCWFEAIEAEGASATATPNFGLDLMARKADMSRLKHIDLSELVIYSGGETCRYETFVRFFERFGPLGFRSYNLRDIMGMAECTLYMSGGAAGDTHVVAFDRDGLRDDKVARRVPLHHPSAQVLLSVGRAVSPQNNTSMIVVDPETHEVLPDGAVGELWTEGPSVATRHITPTDEDSEKFSVPTFPESSSRFLRTGDLAFLHKGMVYICGRTKELIIVGGRNIIPMDIEDVAGSAHPSIRTGCVAAFGVNNPDEGTEGIAVVAEVKPPRKKKHYSAHELDEIVAAIRQSVGHAADADCRYVALVREKTLPKTTSGKLKRLKIRKAFETNKLALLTSVHESATPVQAVLRDSTSDVVAHKGPVTPAQAEEWVVASMCEQLRLEPENLPTEAGFSDFGVDSMTAVRILNSIQERSGVSISPADIFNAPTIQALAALLSSRSVSEALVEQPYVVLNAEPSDSLDVSKTFFCLPPAGGSVFPYVRLAAHVPEFAFVVFENTSAKDQRTFDEVVQGFVETIQSLAPEGPWNLCCYSLGGTYGAAVSNALQDCTLILIDAIAPALEGDSMPEGFSDVNLDAATATGMNLVARSGVLVMDGEGAQANLRRQIHWDLLTAAQYVSPKLPAPRQREDNTWEGVYAVQLRAAEQEDDVRGTIIDPVRYDQDALGWDRLCDTVECHRIPGGHFSVLDAAHAPETAKYLLQAFSSSPHSPIRD